MGLIEFVQSAGAKLLGIDDDLAEAKAEAASAVAQALASQVAAHGLKIENLEVSFSEGTATVSGVASSQADREKTVLVMGNVKGVKAVDDQLTVAAPQAQFYTVQSGDTLSKIAKSYYGDAMKYPVIFEANTPMLKNPDQIYPGQLLRIPPLGEA